MRRERKVKNRLKKENTRILSMYDYETNQWSYVETYHILHTIDYNKALIKELLK